MADEVQKMRIFDSFRRGLVDLVESLDADGLRMVEVGSYAGESAEIFMATGKIAEMWCVDIWTNGYDPADASSYSDFGAVERAFDRVMARHAGRMHKFKGTLRQFFSANPDLDPDIVYIDAEHTFSACADDIQTALGWKDLRFVAGHDYLRDVWPGVCRAVDTVLGGPDAVFQDTSWLRDISIRRPRRTLGTDVLSVIRSIRRRQKARIP